MPGNSELVSFEIDPSAALAAQKKINAGQDETEKKLVGSIDRINKAQQSQGDNVIRITDRSRSSIDRLVASVEKQASAYGKTGVERLIQQRDQYIQRLNGEQQAIDRVTASYNKMIAGEQKLERDALAAKAVKQFEGALLQHKEALAQQTAAVKGYGDSLSTLIASPMSAAAGMFRSLAASAGPVGVGIAGIATALAGIYAAGIEATRALGEYGNEVHDLGIKTGLSAKEVGQFSYAAKLSGDDINVFVRGMRGLTEAIEDNSDAGEKARKALQRLGVSVRDMNGEVRPTAQILKEVSEGFNKMPNALERNKVGMEIFKKAWMEMAPAMMDLAGGLKAAENIGVGPKEADIERWNAYKDKITEVDALWARLARKIQDGIGGTIWIDIKGAGAKLLLGMGNGTTLLGAVSAVAAPGATLGGFGGQAVKKAYNDYMNPSAPEAPGVVRPPDIAYSTPGDRSATAALKKLASVGLEAEQKELEKRKQNLEEIRNEIAHQELYNTTTAAQKQAKLVEANKEYKAQSDLVKQITKDESLRIGNMEKIRDLIRQGIGGLVLGAGTANQSIVSDQDMARANSSRRPPTFFGGNQMSAAKQVDYSISLSDQTYREGLQVIGQNDVAFVSPESARGKVQNINGEGISQQGLAARAAGEADFWKRQNQERLSAIHAEADATIHLLELRSGDRGEMQTARDVAQVRQDAIEREFAMTRDLTRYREDSLQNELDMRVKIAEIQHKQLEEVKQETQSLLHTLFTSPSSFGKQLGTTLRDASLKPIESGLAGIISKPIDRVIHGADGSGGIAGFFRDMFGGSKPDDPAKNTATNTKKTVSVLEDIRSLLSGGSIPGSSGVAARPGGGFGGFGIGMGLGGLLTTPPFLSSASAAEAAASGGGSSTAGLGRLTSGLWDRTGSAAAITTPSFSGAPIPGIGGGATGSAGGGGGLSGIGNMLGLSNMWKNAKGGLTSIGNLGSTFSAAHGGLNGAGGGALVLGGGIAAFDGLRRGGWLGAAETTAGGAAIGYKFGGAWGAAIGAAVGFAAGLIRMAFKSRAQQVQEQVQGLYGVKIDKQYAQQIDQIAKQAYGGSISTAIRSPQVMEMLSLYSQATGQKFAYNNAPKAASLIESGNTLYQGASYYGGTPYSFGSQAGLPTYGSANASPMYTASGGGMVSVQLDGAATTAVLRGEIASAPQEVAGSLDTAQANSFYRRTAAARMLRPGLVRS